MILTIIPAFSGCVQNNKVLYTHILPENYIGKVIISFNQPDGDKTFKNDTFTFNINVNGQKSCVEELPLGFVNENNTVFYYKNSKEELIKIPLNSKKIADEDIAIRGIYPVGNQIIYFIDKKKNLANYKNPAIDETPRNN